MMPKLGWKTIKEFIISDTAVMMFKIMNNMYLTGIFQPLRDVHELTLRDTYLNLRLPLRDVHELTLRDTYLNLRLPHMSTNMGQRSYSYQGADIWSMIDQKNKMGTSL